MPETVRTAVRDAPLTFVTRKTEVNVRADATVPKSRARLSTPPLATVPFSGVTEKQFASLSTVTGLEAIDVVAVKAAELSRAHRPAAARPRQALAARPFTGSGLRRPRRLIPPDPPEGGDQHERGEHGEEQRADLARVRIPEDVARQRHVARHPPDLVVQPDSPGVAG